jgi:branched-chain amino acid transport system substrate-binding protein
MPIKPTRRGMLAGTAGAAITVLGGRPRYAAAAVSAGVKIGVIGDMSSTYADVAGRGSVEATAMAIEDFGGNVLGQPIALVSADALNKPDVALSLARQWWDADGVDAIADVPTSAIAFALMTLSAEKQKILLVSSAASSQVTGAQCSPYTTQWTYDSYAMANCTGTALMRQGARRWYFIAADYAFGDALVADTTAVIKAGGGEILGISKVPLGTTEFSSSLLLATSSGADIICMANGGADMINALKQAADFGIRQRGQRMAGLVVQETDIRSLGLAEAQGLLLTTAFYWDLNDRSRAWSKRFMARMGRMPTMLQAGAYSQALHYLKAVKSADTKEAGAVMAAMRATPVDDMFATGGTVLANGRMVHDMYLMQVKSPEESTGEWDIFRRLQTIPGDQAFRTLAASGCRLT